MRAVIDTNVLVSGFLKDGTPPSGVIADIFSGHCVVLYDQRILDEYRKVLARPQLSLPLDRVDELLSFVLAKGVEVKGARFERRLPDPDDQPFADVAFTGQADLLITGNVRDFPVGDAIRIATPRQWLDIKEKGLG